MSVLDTIFDDRDMLTDAALEAVVGGSGEARKAFAAAHGDVWVDGRHISSASPRWNHLHHHLG